ncbi:response regulator transcription factor [Oscillospiraceae bacterium PP1C4]
MPKRIYIADDEKNIRLLIQSFLTKEGFETICFEDGASLLAVFEQDPCDLVILDVMMPGLDGLTLCAEIRRQSDVPIIIVSAKDGAIDRVTGITLGSDDYLVKPFLPLELVARVKALFRRSEMTKGLMPETEALCFGDLKLEPGLRAAQLNGQPFAVTPAEFDFLAYLIRHRDRAVSRDELLKTLWQIDYSDADTRVADDVVKRLRKKLKERDSDLRIETVWGFGFRLACGEETP